MLQDSAKVLKSEIQKVRSS